MKLKKWSEMYMKEYIVKPKVTIQKIKKYGFRYLSEGDYILSKPIYFYQKYPVLFINMYINIEDRTFRSEIVDQMGVYSPYYANETTISLDMRNTIESNVNKELNKLVKEGILKMKTLLKTPDYSIRAVKVRPIVNILLDNGAHIPTYGTEYAAGADLYAVIHNDTKTVEILPCETAFLDTGVTMEIPEGYVGLVYARSGLSCKQGLAPANKVGVIDADYRSSVKVALYNQSKEVRTVSDGDRIAQIIIQPVTQFEFKEVDKLSETNRGEGGFGSTGKA